MVFTEPAEQDLLDIEYYIFVELCNPSASQKTINDILNAIERMTDYPMGHSTVNDKILSQIGLRVICVNNYNVFYYYSRETELVYIIRILYNKVDWQNVL